MTGRARNNTGNDGTWKKSSPLALEAVTEKDADLPTQTNTSVTFGGFNNPTTVESFILARESCWHLDSIQLENKL
jgi:hypothetical protein